MAVFRRSISQSELAAKQSDADRAQHGKSYSAETGGWTEPVKDQPVAGTGSTDQDSSGARKWWN